MEYREIKFRVWDIEENKMLGCVDIEEWTLHFLQDQIDSGEFNEIMQYTGCKDKNGVDIYEGDIIEWQDDTDSVNDFPFVRDVVIYNSRIASFCVNSEEHWISNLTGSDNYIEVIGNIYENSNLLKGYEDGEDNRN